MIVEFFGVRPPKHVHVLKFIGFCRNEGREREKSLLLNTISVARRGLFDGCAMVASIGRDWRFFVAASRAWEIDFWRSISSYPPWQHLRKRGEIRVYVIDFVIWWGCGR